MATPSENPPSPTTPPVKSPSECKDDVAKLPSIKTDKWDVEYHELSEDFRHLRTLGWQAPFAVLLLDATLLIPASTLWTMSLPARLGSVGLILVGGLFTVFMGVDVLKWIRRGDIRNKRLREYDCQAGFGRYFPKEPEWWMHLPVAKAMAWLVILVGLVLGITSIALLGISIG